MRVLPPLRGWDHPRIRGEHSCVLSCVSASAGSSPHTRGAPPCTMPPTNIIRIIPAYAGSTRPRGSGCTARRDHPRIRGEHRGACPCRPGKRGSSPHTRGAPSERLDIRPATGIIPAYAGSTAVGQVERVIVGDHPRIRGEHPQYPSTSSDAGGSSPHTRGALQTVTPFSNIPRMVGSSPHTRGARVEQEQSHPVHGIIPAYAGSTINRMHYGSMSEDHPRIRGEHYVFPSVRR